MQSFKMNQLHLIATILFSLLLGTNAFSYKEAKNWGIKYSHCNGRHQSPILFVGTDPTSFKDYKKTMIIKNFQESPKKLTIKNTGHNVEITADWTGEPPKISSGPLNGTYILGKTTLHWAQKEWTNEVAADPDISEVLWQDMEMHMMFYKTELKSFEAAEKQKGGLAVVSMGLTSRYDDDSKHLFDSLEKNLHKVRIPNTTADIPSFAFTKIFDESSKQASFYYYEGSLDYPPCLESVPWFVTYTGYAVISKGLIHELRKIKLSEGDVSNVRPHQPINGRQVSLVSNREMHKNHD